MSNRHQLKVVTITKQDEANLGTLGLLSGIVIVIARNVDKKGNALVGFKSFEETFKPKKSAIKSNTMRNCDQNHIELDDNITREQIMEKLQIKEHDHEKEIDLNDQNIVVSARNKQDLSKNLMASLDRELEKLRFMCSGTMAERFMTRKEQINHALEEGPEDKRFDMTFGSGREQMESALRVVSPFQKQAYENMNKILEEHRENIENIEREYLGKAGELGSSAKVKAEIVGTEEQERVCVSERGRREENLKHYSKIDPPPLLNSYMINPHLMSKKKETPQEQRIAQLEAIAKKRNDLKSYKDKFIEYLEDKRIKIEREKEERAVIVETGSKSVLSSAQKVCQSPEKRSRVWSLTKAQGMEAETPSTCVVSPDGYGVKNLTGNKENKEVKRARTVRRMTEEELGHLMRVFNSMKKGERPTANKEDIYSYVVKKPLELEVFNVDLINLRSDLYDFPSEFKNAMSLEEFIAFLNDPRPESEDIVLEVVKMIEGNEQVLKETYMARKRKDFIRSLVDEGTVKEMKRLQDKFKNICLLSEETLGLFKEVFYRLSGSQDEGKIVNRLELVRRIREDEKAGKVLAKTAVNISEYNERVTVEEILREIEEEYENAYTKDKKALENITLTQFLKYFTHYEVKGMPFDEEIYEEDRRVNWDIEGEDEEDSEDEISPSRSVAKKYMGYKREIKDNNALKVAVQEDFSYKEEDIKSSGSKFGAVYKESTDYKITEPVPFSFDEREKYRKKTIRERKLEQMLLEKEKTELEALNYHFKANPVPKHAKIQLYDEIMRAQEDRRRQVKMESITMTRARENPFSFYQRDNERPKTAGEPPMNPEFSVRIKAKPLPKHVHIRNLWTIMQEQEEAERKERIAYNAEMNARLSALPPRMASAEARKKEMESEKARTERVPSCQKPFRANPVPDFERLQQGFQELLDKKKMNKKLTEPVGFKFQETRKGVVREYLNTDNQVKRAGRDPNKRDPLEAVNKLKATKPKIQPATTKKTLAMVDKLRADKEEAERKKIVEKMEEEKRMEKYRKMKPRVQCCIAVVEMAKRKDEEERNMKKGMKKEIMERERRFEEEMEAMRERVENRQLLVEQEAYKWKGYTGDQETREKKVIWERDPRKIDPLDYLSAEERKYFEDYGHLAGSDKYEGVITEENEEESQCQEDCRGKYEECEEEDCEDELQQQAEQQVEEEKIKRWRQGDMQERELEVQSFDSY